MSYSSNTELEKIRPSVTGIGWATPQQAALYLNVSHRVMIEQILPHLPYRIVGRKQKRIRYSDLDDWMLTQGKGVNIQDIVDEVMEDLR